MLCCSSLVSCGDGALLKVAYKLNVAFLQDNFVRFFRLARNVPPLARCVLLPKVDHVRRCVCGTGEVLADVCVFGVGCIWCGVHLDRTRCW